MIPYRMVLVAAAGLVLQLTLFSTFSFDGARPEILVLLVLAVGHRLGPDAGAVAGFGVGLAFDVFVTTPFGLTALVYLVAGYLMGRVVPPLTGVPWWVTALVLSAGSGIVMLGYGVVGEIIGLETLRGPAIGTIMVFVALVDLVLAPLAMAAVRWIQIEPRARRRSSVYA